jgi:hypothetical protein
LVNGGVLGTPSSGTATNLTGLPLSTGVTGTLPVANGGTGTATPSIVAGTNVTITGTWPNQTIAASGGGTPGGSTTQVQYNNAGAFGGITGATTNGTALTLVAPVLGTPASATLTNATGLPLSTGVTGTLPVANGGTGLTTTPANGALDIGNGTGFTRTTLTAGSGVTITNASGAITIASSGASAATPTALGTVYGATTGNASPYNALIGYNAGIGMTSGVSNTAIGWEALKANTSANNNTAVGYRASYTNTTGTENTVVGLEALYANSTGSYNTAFGKSALQNNTTSYNTVFGHRAMLTNTTGSGNVGMGVNALFSNTTGTDNICVGNGLQANTTGSNNVAVGATALNSNTTASYQTAVGHQALNSANKTANTIAYSTAVGYQAGKATTTGTVTAIGANVLLFNTTGSGNVGVGGATDGAGGALQSNTTGTDSTAVGVYSLALQTTGVQNVGIGLGAGQVLTTGGYSAFIGGQTYASSSGASNEIVIGYGSTAKGGSTGFINPNGGGVYQGNNSANWSTTSDQRLKKNIVNNDVGLEKLTQIQVRNFEYRTKEEVTELPQNQTIQKSGIQLGVIAQELQAVLPDCVKTESTGVMSVNSDNLTWYMINAIKELKAEFDAYKLTHP